MKVQISIANIEPPNLNDMSPADELRYQLEYRQKVKEELAQLFDDTCEQIEALTDQIAHSSGSTPMIGDKFWYVSRALQVFMATWNDSSSDRMCLAAKNVFLSKDEAIRKRDKLKTVQKLQRLADKYNAGNHNPRWALVPHTWYGKSYIDASDQVEFTMLPRYSTKAIADRVIVEVGVNRILALFNGGESCDVEDISE